MHPASKQNQGFVTFENKGQLSHWLNMLCFLCAQGHFVLHRSLLFGVNIEFKVNKKRDKKILENKIWPQLSVTEHSIERT